MPECLAALAGVKAPLALAGVSFEHLFLNLQAAVNDLGVAMGSLALVEDDLASGRLVRLFPQFSLRDAGFQMIYRVQSRSDPALRTFTDWLMEKGAGKAG